MKKSLLLFLLVALCSAFIVSCNDKPQKKYKIAIMNYSKVAEVAIDGLKEGLAGYGYVKGKNIEYIYSGVIRDKDKLKEEAKRLVAMNPDILYTMSTPATFAAKEAVKGTNVPIVFGPVSTPIEAGIIPDFLKSKGNITGVTFGPQEYRRMEILIKMNPNVKAIIVPYNSNDKSPIISMQKAKKNAKLLGLEIVPIPGVSDDDILTKLNNYNAPYDAIYMPTDSMQVNITDEIAKIAIANNAILTCPHKEGVDVGALFSYGFSIRPLGIQSSRLVHMVLSGTKAETIPVELADFSMTINLKTAKELNLDIPSYLIKGANIVR
jgi:putative ABC transport system substrate-binding protein